MSASLLIALLKAALAVCPQDDDGVFLLWWGDGRPIGIMSKNDQVAFNGLLMPMDNKP